MSKFKIKVGNFNYLDGLSIKEDIELRQNLSYCVNDVKVKRVR